MRTLDKPAGLPVLPPHGHASGDCLLARLLVDEPWRRDVAWPAGFEGGIAHRLDTMTSGAVLVADDVDELARLRTAFAGGRLRKTYRLRAAKDVPWDDNHVTRPIAHDARRKSRMVVQRGEATPHRGKWYPADTTFRRVSGDVWEAVITTGVMHQIRVHAAFVGIPLLGDALYGGGDPPTEATWGGFFLHHVGLEGEGIATEPVPTPAWVPPVRDAS